MSAQDLEQREREVGVKFNAAFFVSSAGNRIEQLTTYEDYCRNGAVLALMDLGQKRASAKKLTKKGGGQVVLAWVSAPQPIIEDDDSSFAHQPAPVVDDARMARALEAARCGLAPEHVSAIEEAIAAYDPNCGARTVRVVDDAMRELIAADGEYDAACAALNTVCDDEDHEAACALFNAAKLRRAAALARAQGVQS